MPKDGFDEKTNSTVRIAGVEFSFPDYYVFSKGENGMDYYYAEQGSAVAMIGVQSIANTNATESDFNSSKNAFVANFAKSAGLSVDSTKDVSVAGLPGCIAELHGKISDTNTLVMMLLFYNERASAMGVLSFAQSDNTKYDYSADFAKIIKSARLSAEATEEPNTQSSSSSSSTEVDEEEESSSAEAITEEEEADSPGAPSEEDMLAALESVMPQETAYKAATVSFTNQMADDVGTSDGNSLDPSKFHSYSDQSGFFLKPKGKGTWSYVDESTWHVDGLEYTTSTGLTVEASCDVHFDGANYIISNQSGMSYNPGHKEWGTPLEDYDTPSSDPARIVTPNLLS